MAKSRTPAELKAAKQEAKVTRKAASKQRRQQLWQTFQLVRKEDSVLLPYMVAIVVVVVVYQMCHTILASAPLP